MTTRPKVVQFVHPGLEYSTRKYVGDRKQRSGVMPWKEGGSIHNRKFMWHPGSAFDVRSGVDHVDVPLTLWGEWEGHSVFWKLHRPEGELLPSIVHAPFRPAEVPTTSVQNTDPMVFGDAFIYSNCRQEKRVLRGLPEGSIILFGRLGKRGEKRTKEPFFTLDACLVVDRIQRLPARPFDAAYGSDIVEDIALCALYSEGHRGDLLVHTGRTRAQADVFSFVPARVSVEAPSLFARPELRPVDGLEDVVSPGTQAINVTHDLSDGDRDGIWKAVVHQVTEQGCVLGYHAAEPAFLKQEDTIELAQREPRPLMPDGFPRPTTIS